MIEINNLQTIQTNHQWFINQLNQTTNYNKERNTAEYKPNASNSNDVELRKVEIFYDWLFHYSDYTKQIIESGNKYVESFVVHKEKFKQK